MCFLKALCTIPVTTPNHVVLVFRIPLVMVLWSRNNCIRVQLYWSESETSLATSLQNGLQPNFQVKSLLFQCKHTTGESRYPFQATSLSLQCNCSIRTPHTQAVFTRSDPVTVPVPGKV